MPERPGEEVQRIESVCRGHIALDGGPLLECRKPAFHGDEPHAWAMRTSNGKWVNVEWRMLFDAPELFDIGSQDGAQ